tara:strand:+ start:537 stop:809 length:273 start_codon:yes stop_codon:yes gene_type:complete
MSDRTLVAGAEAALPTTTGTGTSFSEATVVRLINNSGTARLVTVVEEQGGTVVGSFTMPGNTVEFLQKRSAHCIFAGANTVLGAKVGFTG